MKLQNVFVSALSALMLLGASGAHASLIKVEFKTEVQRLLEWESTSTGDYVQETTIAGKHVAVGDSVAGYFIYDTTTPASPYPFPPPYPATAQVFYGGIASYLIFDKAGLTYQSNLPGHTYVRDGVGGPNSPDRFLMRTLSLVDNDYFEMQMELWDPSGLAITGPGLPSTLPRSPSSTYSLKYNWYHGNNPPISVLGAIFDVHSVELRYVPEPGTVFLLAASLALCLTSRRTFKR